MNFGEVIKKEILNRPIKDKRQKIAFLAGVVRGNGALYRNGEREGLLFRLKSENALSVVSSYFAQALNYELREISVEEDRLNKTDNFTVYVSGEGAKDALVSLGVLTETGENISVNFNMFTKELTGNAECLKAFFRGLFITTGGCTLPERGAENHTGYHLELTFSHPETASAAQGKLLDMGIKAKIMRRKESFVIYIKSAEEIKDFLAFLPAPVSVLELTDKIVSGEFMNNLNRQNNCDLGNVTRQIEGSQKQIAAINKLLERVDKRGLKPELILVANARLEYPEDTLSELAERLNLTKSCINHRLRKLLELSKNT